MIYIWWYTWNLCFKSFFWNALHATIPFQVDRLREELERISSSGEPGQAEQNCSVDSKCDISNQAKEIQKLEQQIMNLERGKIILICIWKTRFKNFSFGSIKKKTKTIVKQ